MHRSTTAPPPLFGKERPTIDRGERIAYIEDIGATLLEPFCHCHGKTMLPLHWFVWIRNVKLVSISYASHTAADAYDPTQIRSNHKIIPSDYVMEKCVCVVAVGEKERVASLQGNLAAAWLIQRARHVIFINSLEALSADATGSEAAATQVLCVRRTCVWVFSSGPKWSSI